MENLTAVQIEWLWRCRKPTKAIPLDVMQALMCEELVSRTHRGVVMTESGRALLHRDELTPF